MSEKLLPVAEIYGPVFQGEGQHLGSPTIFIRFGGCDYRCTWCDSLFAVDPMNKPKWKRVTAPEIVRRVDDLLARGRMNFPSVTLSGGNPALYDLTELVVSLRDKYLPVRVETQGSRYKNWFKEVDHVTFSPKPPSAGHDTNIGDFRRVYEATYAVTDVSIKIVIKDRTDLLYAVLLSESLELEDEVVFVQPCNEVLDVSADTRVVAETLLNKLAELESWVLEAGLSHFRVLPQLHTLIHGNKRAK